MIYDEYSRKRNAIRDKHKTYLNAIIMKFLRTIENEIKEIK